MEEPRNSDSTFDLYGDVINPFFSVQSKKEDYPIEFSETEGTSAQPKHLQAAPTDSQTAEIERLTKVNAALKKNISCLYKTAKLEIERKDAEVKKLKEEITHLHQLVQHMCSTQVGGQPSSSSASNGPAQLQLTNGMSPMSNVISTHSIQGQPQLAVNRAQQSIPQCNSVTTQADTSNRLLVSKQEMQRKRTAKEQSQSNGGHSKRGRELVSKTSEATRRNCGRECSKQSENGGSSQSRLRQSRSPFDCLLDKQSRSRRSHSPYESQESRNRKSHSPYESQEKRNTRFHSPYESQEKRNTRSRSPYESQESRNRKSHSPYESQEKRNTRSRSPFDTQQSRKMRSRSPYCVQETRKRPHLPYDNQEPIKRSRSPYDHAQESKKRRSRSPYGSYSSKRSPNHDPLSSHSNSDHTHRHRPRASHSKENKSHFNARHQHSHSRSPVSSNGSNHSTHTNKPIPVKCPPVSDVFESISSSVSELFENSPAFPILSEDGLLITDAPPPEESHRQEDVLTQSTSNGRSPVEEGPAATPLTNSTRLSREVESKREQEDGEVGFSDEDDVTTSVQGNPTNNEQYHTNNRRTMCH